MSEREEGDDVTPGADRRARLERYLLGGLNEADRQAVREEAIVNPDVFAELRDIERDLLGAAARGTIDAEQLTLVQEHLISGEHNRGAWAVAQALADRAAPSSVPLSGQRRHWWADASFGWRVAAAIVLAAGLAGYAGWRFSSGVPPNTMPSAAPAVDRPAPSPAPPAAEAPAAPASPPVPASPPAPATRSTGIVAVYFPAGTMRGSKQEVRIGSSARTVQMAFEIDTPAASSVAVVIRAVPGAEVWSAREVPVRLREGMRTAVIDLPASLLQNGSYEATVALAGEAGVEQLFPFLVRRD